MNINHATAVFPHATIASNLFSLPLLRALPASHISRSTALYIDLLSSFLPLPNALGWDREAFRATLDASEQPATSFLSLLPPSRRLRVCRPFIIVTIIVSNTRFIPHYFFFFQRQRPPPPLPIHRSGGPRLILRPAMGCSHTYTQMRPAPALPGRRYINQYSRSKTKDEETARPQLKEKPCAVKAKRSSIAAGMEIRRFATVTPRLIT